MCAVCGHVKVVEVECFCVPPPLIVRVICVAPPLIVCVIWCPAKGGGGGGGGFPLNKILVCVDSPVCFFGLAEVASAWIFLNT